MSRLPTRERLLNATLELLAERGGDLRVEDVATAAGVTRQTVYLNFGSRTGLLVAAVEHLDADGTLASLTREIIHAPNGVAALDAAVHLEAAYDPVIYPVAKVLIAARRTDEAALAAWQNRMEVRRNGARHVVERLAREGSLDPSWEIEAATDLAFALVSFEVWEHLVIERGWSASQYEEHLRRVLHAALLRDAPGT